MTLGAAAWFRECERLRAGHASFLVDHTLPLKAGATAFDLDVNMEDTPILFTPSAGQKRLRDDDDDADVFQHELRVEKVSNAPIVAATASNRGHC